MEKKINIAELLKDCPKGMELDCINYDGIVTFEKIINSPDYPIVISIKHNDECCKHTLTKYGQTCKTPYNKCIIFPKGKTTWKDFEPSVQFKDGDIVSTSGGHYTFILKGEAIKKESYYTGNVYFGYRADTDYIMNNNIAWHFSRLATEEEKQKLFDAIKANSYKWNAKTLTLEKLIIPKFKVGDRIQSIRVNLGNIYNIIEVKESLYVVNKHNENSNFHIDFEIQDDWELVPNKFDINTLIPFESKVLMRDDGYSLWQPGLWGFYDKEHRFPYVTIGNRYKQCIPYRGNEYLLGTNDKCDDYYKTWE